jgi:hypothetical protein
MVLQHPSLSGTLTEQHREGLRQQAELARLARNTGNPRRSLWHATYRWWRPATRTARTWDARQLEPATRYRCLKDA